MGRILSVALSSCLFLWVSACGSTVVGGGGDGDGSGGADSGTPPGGCQVAADCPGTAVCDPATNECNASLSCDAHSDCGKGGFCPSGICQSNQTGGVCEEDLNCPVNHSCVGGYCGCEGVEFAAEPVTPNIMIVLDRSYSMQRDFIGANVGPDDEDSKWFIAENALDALLADYAAKVRFGLVTFASDNDCDAGEVDVAIGDATAPTIMSAIENTDPLSNTPIVATLNGLVGNSGLADTTRPNYILLVTDGGESCAGGDQEDQQEAQGDAAEALRDQTPTVKTFVVGFGGGVDPVALNLIAEKGGTALPGATKYYQADDAQELAEALAAILGSALSCTYELDQVPQDLDQLYVYADQTEVTRDPAKMNGWDVDPTENTLTFYGPICDQLTSGQVNDLAIVYGCPGAPVD